MDKRLGQKEWRISHLYEIRDKDANRVRFARNRAQEHFAKNKWYRNIILKSRQIGFTTDEAIDSLDDVLFTRNYDALLIAQGLDEGKSIFDKKIEYAWKNMDPRLKGLYKVDTNSARTLKFDFGDGAFSSIIVETSGRSGTFQRVHITEFADICKKYPLKAQEIIEGTIPAVPLNGRVDIESTSQGASGAFYEIFIDAWQRGEPTLPVQFKAHFYNWTWDDAEIAKINDAIPFARMEQGEKFAEYAKQHNLTDIQITYYYQKWLSLKKDWNALHREYPTTPEEAFDAIIEGSFYGEAIGRMERDKRIAAVPHDKALKVHTAWDLGVGKNLVVGFYQRDKANFVRKIDYWQGEEGDGLTEAIAAIKGRPYVYGKHFAPHDIKAMDMSTSKTRVDTAKALGLDFTVVAMLSVEDGINAARLLLDRLYADKEKCAEWIKAMKNYIRLWDDKRGMYKDEPFHNWASHGADEFRYAAVAEEQMTNDEPKHYVQPVYEPTSIYES